MIRATDVVAGVSQIDPMSWAERWGLGAGFAAMTMLACAWIVRTWLSKNEATIKAAEEERRRLQEQNAAQMRDAHAELMAKLEVADERYAALLERYHQLLERQAVASQTTQAQLAELTGAATRAIEAILAKLPPAKGARP